MLKRAHAALKSPVQRWVKICLSRLCNGISTSSLSGFLLVGYRHASLYGASHSGRGGFLTNSAEKGVSVRMMIALAGHVNMTTAQRYIDLRPGVLRNEVELASVESA